MRVKNVNVLVRYAAVALGNWLFIQELRLELEIPRDTACAKPSNSFSCASQHSVADRADRTIAQQYNRCAFADLEERFHRVLCLIHVILTENGFANVGRKWSAARRCCVSTNTSRPSDRCQYGAPGRVTERLSINSNPMTA